MLSNIHPKYILTAAPKPGKRYNPVHDEVNNTVATVIDLTVGERGWIAVYMDYDWHRLHLSTIEDIVWFENGNITVTTRNTVYTLTKLVE